MMINLTKGKLIRWIIAAFVLFCSPVQAVDVPRAALAAVEQREFMAGFTGYDDYSLLDVYVWTDGLIGVAMLCPVGFRETHVYDCRNGGRKLIYRDAYVPTKKRREELRRESVTIYEAVRLAKAAVQAEGGNILSARD
jgi:hypothetical protein